MGKPNWATRPKRCTMDCFTGTAFFSRDVSLLYDTGCNFNVSDVEDWMWQRGETRAGYWTITIPLRTGRLSRCDGREEVIRRRVNLSQKEYALLDKVVSNQIYAESKAKIYRAVVYQRSLQLWDAGSDDDVAMRTIGPWAVAYYKCQANKFYAMEPRSFWNYFCPTTQCVALLLGWVRQVRQYGFMMTPYTRALILGCIAAYLHWRSQRTQERKYRAALMPNRSSSEAADTASESSPGEGGDDAHKTDEEKKSKKNKLGYQKTGEEYINEHPGGGNDDDDSEIRATVEGRIIRKDCGIGVVGQTTDDTGRKQVCGVLSQPISVEPNVYAQEALNAIKAIEERITKKQRPYAGSAADEKKIRRMVDQSMFGKKNAPFSAKKIMDTIHSMVYEEIKSSKWTESRVTEAIESLCREIDPEFKLKAAVKLEPMPEEKAPRLLIADEDRGQVMALMTIYTIETLIKKHFPEKGIKGLAKKDAIKRVMKACKVPRKVAKKLVTIFEGDGTAWDTTCSAKIRELVENPVINHVASMVNGFMHADPHTWAEAHASICAKDKLDMSYTKNKEYQKITIDAIRRSGHRGTSCLNWWMNFVCWHCAVFEDPELFLDPSHRYGKDVTGVIRWMNSAFEGDDSFLVTSPRIEEGKTLHTNILQFWERIGFNMKIEIRKERALFVGYYMGLDESGPVFDEKNDEWMMIPEVDRCFTRAGTSCSPSMIEAFKANDRDKCRKFAATAAMSRAYEFAGLSPTISEKFLRYATYYDFELDHDLKMRTNQAFDDKFELIDHIHALNCKCSCEDKILLATGFWSSDDERSRFIDYVWDYDQLADWEGFRASLPQSWRQ